MKPKASVKKYSVLLMYPDYHSDNYGEETYYDFVMARSPREAVQKARKRCKAINDWSETDCPKNDLAPLLVTRGWHHGLDGGR